MGGRPSIDEREDEEESCLFIKDGRVSSLSWSKYPSYRRLPGPTESERVLEGSDLASKKTVRAVKNVFSSVTSTRRWTGPRPILVHLMDVKSVYLPATERHSTRIR